VLVKLGLVEQRHRAVCQALDVARRNGVMSGKVSIPPRVVPYLAVTLSWGFAHRTSRPVPTSALPYPPGL
jgi:hypothetical protein